MPADCGVGGKVGDPKLPGGGCVGVHPTADGVDWVGGGGEGCGEWDVEREGRRSAVVAAVVAGCAVC